MITAQPSRTAQRVAMRRAAHQILDAPKVFDDPLAIAIAGPEAPAELQQLEQDRSALAFSRALRAFLAVRSRYAEDRLGASVSQGVRQYVILGAGLDTFAYRNPWRSVGLRVFEVDHPTTQEWKRGRLTEAGITIPETMAFAPVDFERESLSDGLLKAGFDPRSPVFFSWLGVTPYLSRAAFHATVQFIASMPSGSGVVFDFALDRSLLNPLQRALLDRMAARVARAGEPFRLFFDPRALSNDLAQLGFGMIEDLASDEINARYFAHRADGLRVAGGGHLLCARIL